MTLKKTPLNDWHRAQGARMVEFGGWEMPVQYKGVIEEHLAVRQGVGLFDISHMGEIFVEGKQARDFINFITTNNIGRIGDGQCQYACVCYDDGGVVDDVISYQYNPEKYLVVVNASNTQKDFEWFASHSKNFEVALEDRSSLYCQFALQGPKAADVLQKLVSFELTHLKPFHFIETKVAGHRVICSRTGYTGEDGFEIYGASEESAPLWAALLEAGKPLGIEPIGLAARDTLRLEACYSLYGHEIARDINPYEAGLGWAVKLDKPKFIGQEALTAIKKNGAARTLVGLEMVDSGIPRQGYSVCKDGVAVGQITSGTFLPTRKTAVGLALVDRVKAGGAPELAVEMRGQKRKAKVVSLPFYKRQK